MPFSWVSGWFFVEFLSLRFRKHLRGPISGLRLGAQRTLACRRCSPASVGFGLEATAEKASWPAKPPRHGMFNPCFGQEASRSRTMGFDLDEDSELARRKMQAIFRLRGFAGQFSSSGLTVGLSKVL